MSFLDIKFLTLFSRSFLVFFSLLSVALKSIFIEVLNGMCYWVRPLQEEQSALKPAVPVATLSLLN